jgi:hypothetical protein
LVLMIFTSRCTVHVMPWLHTVSQFLLPHLTCFVSAGLCVTGASLLFRPQVYAAGNPQYGQLGDGSDHAYNAKDSEDTIH